MVNLNRQIGVLQARQGGFSSHVLPGPVGYDPLLQWTFTPDSLDVIKGPSGVAMPAEIVELVSGTGQLEVAYQATGGAGGGPAAHFSVPSADIDGVPYGTSYIHNTSPDARIRPQNPNFTIESFVSIGLNGGLNTLASSQVFVYGASEGIRLLLFTFAQTTSGGDSFHVVGFIANGGTSGLDRRWVRQSLPAGFNHYAASAEDGIVRIFYNGQPIHTQGFSPTTPGLTGSEFTIDSDQIPPALERFVPAYAGFGSYDTAARDVSFSFSRFTLASLYTSNFTPPQL